MDRDLIFVSYSHADTAWLDRLRIFLKPFAWGQSHRDGGRLWADPYLKTGERWRREIEDGLLRARVAVLLVSQDFLASDFIMKDELPPILAAAEAGELTLVCVPVSSSLVDLVRKELLEYQWSRPPDQPLDLLAGGERTAALAQVSRKLHEAVETVGLSLAAAKGPAAAEPVGEAAAVALRLAVGTPGTLHGVPPQRPHHVARPEVRERLRRALLAGTRSSVGITGTSGPGGARGVGVFGQGGLGKTVTAIDLVQDEEVQRAFPDGIHWLTLGQQPDLPALQAELLEQATGAPAVVESVASGTRRLQDLLAGRACLLVLDDIWSADHARAFEVAGARCRTLATTRDAGILTALGAENVELDLLDEEQALALLTEWTSGPRGSLSEEARALVRRCGYLPLAIAVAGAIVRDGTACGDVLAALEEGNLRFLDHPYASVFTSLRLSVDALPEPVRERCLELAVVPEDVTIPVSVVARLWVHTGGLRDHESRSLLAKLQAKALLYVEDERDGARVRFHDLQRDFLQLAAEDVAALHTQLLEAYAATLGDAPAATHRAWWTLPADEPYLWHHLTGHLAQAGRHEELRALLLDHRWIAAKLAATDINALLADYDHAAVDRAPELVGEALRLSAHVLAEDPSQLAGQLTGRLLRESDAGIRALLSQISRETREPWLRPLTPSLTPPGGALMRTLTGHTDRVTGVAVMDGRRAVSASADRTLRVWDLATGAVLRTLEGHTEPVTAVAVIKPDGRRGMSASRDGTLRVWDLATGAAVHTLEGHTLTVAAVAVTPDGRRAVSASYDRTLRVWDLATGTVLRTVEGHPQPVTAVAVTPDGRRAVSASADWRLRVWDLVTGTVLRTLDGHTHAVTAVAVTPDGRRAVSASQDRTLRVWDLATGGVLHTLEGHRGWVTAVAVTPDGRRAVSASNDRTLRVWDLMTGAALRTLAGHALPVTAVAVAPDGRRAVSASDDRTLRVWELITRAAPHSLAGHTLPVTAVAVAPDGRLAVSTSDDRTLRVWDLATGAALHTLEAHADPVAVTVMPDSWRAVSCCGCGTLQVWNLAAGVLRHTLEGHKDLVTDVAVTSDGRRAVSASRDRTLRVWDLATGAVLHTLEGHTLPVVAVAVTSDGRRAVSASRDRTLRVWDVPTGALLHTLEGHTLWVNAVAVTPDGRRAVSTSDDRTLKVWDLPTGAVLHTLEGHTHEVSEVAVTPEGRRAVSASDDGTLKVWNLATGEELHSFKGHTALVNAVAVTPDGRRAASASRDWTLRMWDMASGALVSVFTADGEFRACAVAPDGVTVVAGDWLGRVHILRLENGLGGAGGTRT